MAVLAAVPALAQPKTNAPPVSVSVTARIPKAQPALKPNWHWLTPLRTTELKPLPTRVDGLSTRAWTTVVGWRPGVPAFSKDITQEPQFCLLWIGHEPWR